MAKPKIEWPKNLTIQGQLTFPFPTKQSLLDVAEWRAKKSIPKPKFKDKIGGGLFLTQVSLNKAQAYLVETYLPFVDTLYKETDGEKGIDPALVKKLLERAKKGEWLNGEGKPDMPIRPLKDKDKENIDTDKYVAKIQFSGPYETVNNGEIEYSAIIYGANHEQRIAGIDELIDEDILPSGQSDVSKLWWGAGWNFRTGLRFNAYDTAGVGVSAYAQKLYLLPHLGLPVMGGNDADVIEDGDDWEDQ